MNVQQEIQAAADLLRETNAAAPADSLGAWEPYFVTKHREAAQPEARKWARMAS